MFNVKQIANHMHFKSSSTKNNVFSFLDQKFNVTRLKKNDLPFIVIDSQHALNLKDKAGKFNRSVF